MSTIESTAEGKRLVEARLGQNDWRQWGPYLSERQWGTVREDYSADGDAWNYISHDDARSRAYRWGEDGIAGISDSKQQLCFALAMWNGQDAILKERLFGLTSTQGNHGEDVKEYYFYVDNTPTHSYMKYLYKYPQKAFPYEELVKTNQERNRHQFEYELLDTAIFDEDRYYDIFVEYAKSSPDEILIRFQIANRGPDATVLHLLPTLWFRNSWSWERESTKPLLELTGNDTIKASHPDLKAYWLYCEGQDEILFTENETNNEKLFATANDSPFVKDGFHSYFTQKQQSAVNPQKRGTKAAVHHKLSLAPGETKTVRLVLSSKQGREALFDREFDRLFSQRKEEADTFYQVVTPYPLSDDMRSVQRQALVGLLWNKQCYHYNVKRWLQGDPQEPKPPQERQMGRNRHWPYLDAYEIFSMPDKWEYPWFAAWDLAFHTISLAMIDPDFAKSQLLLMTREWYMSPDGQIPAYEWNFSDVNPPVQAWAAMRIYQMEREMYGREDRVFLEKMFQKLIINFTWWVNRKDKDGRNIFEGGFLGLDNIGAFNRSLEPPEGGVLAQPDATAWMGMYCLNCLQIALELASQNHAYENLATKFFEHFVYIADAINNVTGEQEGLWDEEHGFYYGLLIHPDGSRQKMYEDSMTGLIPLFVIATNSSDICNRFPGYRERFQWFVEKRRSMLCSIADLEKLGVEKRLLLAFTDSRKLTKILEKMLDEEQFYSPYGIRSVSKRHLKQPFTIYLAGKKYTLDYEPAESTIELFGGNSNWRGPIWFPVNFLLIESLQKFHYYYGESVQVECPAGSGVKKNLWDVASDIAERLISIFLKDSTGRRPVYGGIEKFQNDPYWKDYILFHEYFHGDNGAGLGASNQTGWTSLVAKMIQQYGKYKLQHVPAAVIEKGKIGHV
ncbi:MAG: glucosidase [Verrucomicrobia bacterium]|nr:glucosidase [Verrucomicrobiota bacterium]